MKYEIFKIGDIVFDGERKGEVKKIDYKLDYAILVQFDDYQERYTLKGERFEQDVIPTLSFTPYTVEPTEDGFIIKGFSQERPWKPEYGELILVSCDKNFWYPKFFCKTYNDGSVSVSNFCGNASEMFEEEGSEYAYRYYKKIF